MTAKTVITLVEKSLNTPIEYTFQNKEGDIKTIGAKTTAQARYKLNKLIGKTGYKLIQRRL